ncbi:hypothetical protein ACFWF7_02925 [Nocardia sp. NPDC060256]|uniref:hypothetical protein n=1 Tax=unclassified Nocardia TaxID=2637762 RepID=UPI00364BC35A
MGESTDLETPPAVAGRSAEFWGYVMWGSAGLVIAVPELASATGLAGWPTISATIGHLETQHDWVRVLVVFVIAVVGYYAIPQLLVNPAMPPSVLAGKPVTAGGRVTRANGGMRFASLGGYLVLAGVAYFGAVAYAVADRAVNPDSYLGAYVLYGTIALLWVVVPSLLALFASRDVPFPTLFRTIGYLERRAHPVAAVLTGLLVVLLIHLALYPWPRILD